MRVTDKSSSFDRELWETCDMDKRWKLTRIPQSEVVAVRDGETFLGTLTRTPDSPEMWADARLHPYIGGPYSSDEPTDVVILEVQKLLESTASRGGQ